MPIDSLKPPIIPAYALLDFESLIEAMPGDLVYLTQGSNDIVSTQAIVNSGTIPEEMIPLGELAEAPGKIDSSLDKLRTRNYVIPGKRTNAVEITIAGISNAQKAFLESPDFSSHDHTIALFSRDLTRAVFFTGMRFKAQWAAEVDGIITITISSESAGDSSNIHVLKKQTI